MTQEEQLTQAKQTLAPFKPFFSPFLYAALEEPMMLLMIADKQIDLDRMKQDSYTFSYLFNEFGLLCLNKNYITFDAFLAVPAHERYTLQYLFKDGLEELENGNTDLVTFLSIPEKKRMSYIAALPLSIKKLQYNQQVAKITKEPEACFS